MIDMEKQYYIDRYNKFFDELDENLSSEERDQMFEEQAGYEEIVGYYLVVHGDRAYNQWLENVYGKGETEQDIKIGRTLAYLCGVML